MKRHIIHYGFVVHLMKNNSDSNYLRCIISDDGFEYYRSGSFQEATFFDSKEDAESAGWHYGHDKNSYQLINATFKEILEI